MKSMMHGKVLWDELLINNVSFPATPRYLSDDREVNKDEQSSAECVCACLRCKAVIFLLGGLFLVSFCLNRDLALKKHVNKHSSKTLAALLYSPFILWLLQFFRSLSEIKGRFSENIHLQLRELNAPSVSPILVCHNLLSISIHFSSIDRGAISVFLHQQHCTNNMFRFFKIYIDVMQPVSHSPLCDLYHRCITVTLPRHNYRQ